MTRRIAKDDLLEFVPAVPATPYIPGYEQIVDVWASTRSPVTSGVIRDTVGDFGSGAVRGRAEVGSSRVVAYTWVPAQPATAGAPAYTIDHGVAAWNAGGSSISPLDGDGSFEFYTSDAPGGVVVGLSVADLSLSPSEPSHAFYVHGRTAQVRESGVVVHTFSVAAGESTRYVITRSGSQVYYLIGAAQYVSAKPVTLDKVYLDAALYLSGDYVEAPAMFEGTSGATQGDVYGILPALTGRAGDSRSAVIGTLPALKGVVYSLPAGDTLRVVGSLPPLGGFLRAWTGVQAEIAGTLRPLSGVVSNYAYSFIDGSLPALTGEVSNIDEDSFRTSSSSMSMADGYYGVARLGDRILSTVNYVSVAAGRAVVREYIYDSLLYQGAVTSNQTLFASFAAGLGLGSGLSRRLHSDLSLAEIAGRAPTQYAVNALSGVLTTYDGFDFDAFARCGQRSYASRRDGVYRLRPGDDAGVSRVVAVDFGEVPLGADSAHTIESACFGIRTDGEISVRLASGGKSYLYRADHWDDLARIIGGKGANGRLWNVTLEVEGATFMNLDMIELRATEKGRRWSRR